ncbi:lysozyme C-1-like [Elgaria multicarinata webbii]|uniref:lysozyme C-1-like n=1 Tax=Elgaria multicarinata webbii TaxID=159646 RepID=UPI002FCD01D9
MPEAPQLRAGPAGPAGPAAQQAQSCGPAGSLVAQQAEIRVTFEASLSHPLEALRHEGSVQRAMKAFAVALVSLAIMASEAKLFHRCELAKIFKSHGLDRFRGYSLGDLFLDDDLDDDIMCAKKIVQAPNGMGACSLDRSSYSVQRAVAMKALAVALVSLAIIASEAKVFHRCELAKIFKKHGLDGYHGYSLNNLFQDDDLTDDIRCAKKIVQTPKGMGAW